MKLILTTITILAIGVGCARFSTKQTDTRYDDKGKPSTSITTKAAAWTFWESKSTLANFKATQTEKSQGASVGSLNQEGGGPGTNVVALLQSVVDVVKTAAVK
jgi:hypothetical protein